MSPSTPAAPGPFARLLTDIETAEDLDAVVPADPSLLARILDGWEAVTLEEYAATRTGQDTPRPAPVKAEQPCAVCGLFLEAMDGDPHVPYAADIFTAAGHYGSTMYDPVFGGEHLTLTICESCLTGMRARGAVTRTLLGVRGAGSQLLIWGSHGESETDNPRNELRLKNERALAAYAEANPQAMYPGLYAELMELCDQDSAGGVEFRPPAAPPASGARAAGKDCP